jgi:hypothetical protein
MRWTRASFYLDRAQQHIRMRSITTLVGLVLTGLVTAQTLFSEDFEVLPAFSLNTADANSSASANNIWVINSAYGGGSATSECILPVTFDVPNTATQPMGIMSPQGHYLHTLSTLAESGGITNCCFAAADGLCTDPDNIFARMVADVNTVGAAMVELKFWWLCQGGTQNYGEVYYSVNSGTSWTQVTVPITQYRNSDNWAEQTASLPAFAGQATLRFGFRFHNGLALFGVADPGFAVDDVRIIASNTNPVSIASSVSPLTYCQGASLNVAYTISGTFNAGNVFTAELSNSAGSFASPVTIGSFASTTGGSIACVIPPGTPQGIGYRIRVVSSSPVTTGTDNGTDITVYEAPYAGTDGSLSICTGDDPVSLATGGDAGGTWTGPSTVVDDQYDPATMEPGTYTYTVTGSGPCASDAANVVVTEIPGANAGGSVSTVICKNTGIYDLFQFLGGSPDTGGTWTAPGGGPSDGMFNSAVATGGIYTYAVNGGGSCGADEAVVSVTVGESGEAGPDDTWTVCSDGLPVDLFDLLDVSANPTGVWFNNGIPFDGETDAAGSYVYIDYADVPCSNDTAFITLSVSLAAYAGENGTVQVCNDDPPLSLFSVLAGGPQPGGFWTGPGGAPHSGTFIPGTDAFGLYTYTVDAIEPCDPDEALLAVVLCEVGIAEHAGNSSLVWLGRDGDGQDVFSVPSMKKVAAEVIDAAGRTVIHRAEANISGQFRLDLGALNAGVYTLVLRSAGESVKARFIH